MPVDGRHSLRRPLRWVPALCAIVFLSACPYASEHPLSDPATAAVDAALAGTWKVQDPETEEWNTLSFFPWDEHEMVIFTPGDAGGKAEAYRMFVTIIDGQRFLNVRQLGEKDAPAWFFVNYSIDGSRLVLRVLDDGLFGETRFVSPDALRSFVRRNIADPRLYTTGDIDTPEMVLQRAEG